MKKSVTIILILALIFSLNAFAAAESVETADASTMRLVRTEGTVFLKDEEGTELSLREDMRLYSGNTVETEADSRAGISLDEVKTITLDEDSFVSLHQDGKKLRVNLEAGAMYFSVYQPLAYDEQFEIETSTMVLGIRGTSGYVETISPTVSKVILTSGHVVIKAASGEEYDLYPGKCVVIERTSSGTDFDVSDIYPSGYPDFLREELAADPFQFDNWNYAPSSNDGSSVPIQFPGSQTPTQNNTNNNAAPAQNNTNNNAAPAQNNTYKTTTPIQGSLNNNGSGPFATTP